MKKIGRGFRTASVCCASLTFKLTPSSYPKKRQSYCLDILALDMKSGNTSAISGVLEANISLSCSSHKDLPWLGSYLLLPSFWLLIPMIPSGTQGSPSALMEWGTLSFLGNFVLKPGGLEGTDQSGALCLVLPNSLILINEWYCTWPFWFSSSAAGHEVFPEVKADTLKFSLRKCVCVCVF